VRPSTNWILILSGKTPSWLHYPVNLTESIPSEEKEKNVAEKYLCPKIHKIEKYSSLEPSLQLSPCVKLNGPNI